MVVALSGVFLLNGKNKGSSPIKICRSYDVLRDETAISHTNYLVYTKN